MLQWYNYLSACRTHLVYNRSGWLLIDKLIIYCAFLVLLLRVGFIFVFSDDGTKCQKAFLVPLPREGIINLGYIDNIFMYE